MASNKDDKFTRCFADFVRYLNVVEPFEMQNGCLESRVGFGSRDTGELKFWMQNFNVFGDSDDAARFSEVFDRVDDLVRDLNRCRSFVDGKIAHTFYLFDQDGELRYEVVRDGR